MTKKARMFAICSGGWLACGLAGAAWADIPPMLPAPAADTVVLQLSAAEQWLQRTASVMGESAGSDLPNSVNAAASQVIANGTVAVAGGAFTGGAIKAGTHKNIAQAAAQDVIVPETPAELQAWVEQSLRLVEETGDQRILGQALVVLNALPTTELTPNLRRLRANVYQSLHRFDEAVSDLKAVLVQQGDDAQAVFLLATVQLAQGHYAQAGEACRALLRSMPILISASCGATVSARTGGAQNAYEKLTQLYARQAAPQNVDANPPEINTAVLHFAQVSLAEIAEQIGLPDAKNWWQLALQSRPQNLYARIGAANYAWQSGDIETVLRLTQDRDDVDALQLLRFQALTLQGRSAGTDNADAVLLRLRERVDTAQWRQDTLHARDQAGILLFALHEASKALTLAQINWQQQREPADTRLLLQAAIAAGRRDAYDATMQWLDRVKQTHAQYPVWRVAMSRIEVQSHSLESDVP